MSDRLRKEFEVPVYGGKLIVIVCENLQSVVNEMGIEFDAHGFYGLSHQRRTKTGKREYCVILKPTVAKGCIAHEAKHIVNMVFNHVDVRLDVLNDEPECYFLQWVFSKIEEVFDKYNAYT